MQALDDARKIAEQIKFAMQAGVLDCERLDRHLRDLRYALTALEDEVDGQAPAFELTATGYQALFAEAPFKQVRFVKHLTVIDGGRP